MRTSYYDKHELRLNFLIIRESLFTVFVLLESIALQAINSNLLFYNIVSYLKKNISFILKVHILLTKMWCSDTI